MEKYVCSRLFFKYQLKTNHHLYNLSYFQYRDESQISLPCLKGKSKKESIALEPCGYWQMNKTV